MKWKISTTGIFRVAFTVAVLLQFFYPLTHWYDWVFWGLGIGTIFGFNWESKQ